MLALSSSLQALLLSLSLFFLPNKAFLQDLSATQISTKLSLPKNG